MSHPKCFYSLSSKLSVKLVPSNFNILPSNYEQFIASLMHKAFNLSFTIMVGLTESEERPNITERVRFREQLSL